MSGSDTHADTIREPDVAVALRHALMASLSVTGPSYFTHDTYDNAMAALDALVAERDRERARADRAEAALRDVFRFVQSGGPLYTKDRVELLEMVSAALSAGSGGRETRPEGHEGMVTVYDHNGGYLGCMGRETWEKAVADEAERRKTST